VSQPVDIDTAKQQEILEFEGRLTTNNLFSVLGVSPAATADEVRAAFHDLSKRFHPDRYFGKQLGPFKSKLDAIFRKLSEAHQTLSDSGRRQAYLDANPVVKSLVRQSTGPAAPKSADEALRDAERRARLVKHPYLARHSKLLEALSKAKEHLARAEYSQAFTAVSQAQAIDPNNVEARALMAEVRKKNESSRAATDYQRGVQALEQGNIDGALAAFKNASSVDVTHAKAAAEAARLLEKRGAEPRESTPFAQRAVEADPGNVEYRLLLWRLLEAGGMKQLAKKHFDEAARLAPEHPEVKKHAKRRWPF
jgi:curved DNA-binding protein CbpA